MCQNQHLFCSLFCVLLWWLLDVLSAHGFHFLAKSVQGRSLVTIVSYVCCGCSFSFFFFEIFRKLKRLFNYSDTHTNSKVVFAMHSHSIWATHWGLSDWFYRVHSNVSTYWIWMQMRSCKNKENQFLSPTLWAPLSAVDFSHFSNSNSKSSPKN